MESILWWSINFIHFPFDKWAFYSLLYVRMCKRMHLRYHACECSTAQPTSYNNASCPSHSPEVMLGSSAEQHRGPTCRQKHSSAAVSFSALPFDWAYEGLDVICLPECVANCYHSLQLKQGPFSLISSRISCLAKMDLTWVLTLLAVILESSTISG